ncbi:MAG: cobyric acid synthase [Anaerolineae bacterium]|jgi:adenosylcobyric acid synthase|nr:cobyric acid synthase [Anaerolineae bacterium]MBT3714222.1 cobyric acid synthase [Anaerolineae bacterium]MBT4312345.1 cobyric acid synthase [Anaerolineae bacterium]MBT4457341.1 cobyric acid synthase [Anaerolineae bacterium]MBT4842884.1 cobyric acid synthase [Anaerolineae bacterium]
MKAKTLMIVGSSSSAGKSLLVTALCHYYAQCGVKVAPFKAQNMSNNAAVCPNGSEIGRAQAVQAIAAGLEPEVQMNPILIKPEADSRAQVILMGRAWQTLDARDYYPRKDELWRHVTESLDYLREKYELVIIEGAGSPAELNLQASDIVNMAVAKYAQSPTLLVGDIDRGGIFAQLLGTYWLLPEEEQNLIAGFIVNKFRGDITLFEDGIEILEERSSIPVLGMLPYIKNLYIPEEDAVSLETPSMISSSLSAAQIDIAIIHLPRIANFDDFDPLDAENGVSVRYVDSLKKFGEPDIVIIPGTKSTAQDWAWIRKMGLDRAIQNHAKKGGALVGICGGYQMLGESISDPLQVESSTLEIDGLNLLPIKTTFIAKKDTHQAAVKISNGKTWLKRLENQKLRGYEIHMGRTESKSHFLEIIERNGKKVSVIDGAISEDGKIWGCYIHGIFDNENFRHAWLTSLGWSETQAGKDDLFQESLSRLENSLEESLNMDLLEKIIWED